MSSMLYENLNAMIKSVVKELRDNWTNSPNILELYGTLTLLCSLLYMLFYELDSSKQWAKSGPGTVEDRIKPEYSGLCSKLCKFRNDMNHNHVGTSFLNTRAEILSRWGEVEELFKYLQDYIKARALLENRCKKYHIQDVVTETKTLLNQYCCDDIVELVIMMRADGTLVQ